MEWVDGNLGAKVTMKYPSVYLNGEGARGTMLSIAVAHKGIHQDSGSRMLHNAPNTSSSIVSKSIAKGGGSTDYRGSVKLVRILQVLSLMLNVIRSLWMTNLRQIRFQLIQLKFQCSNGT